MEWSFEASAPVEADLSVPAGSILVGDGDGQVRVEIDPLDPGSPGARRLPELVEVSLQDGRLRVHLPSKPVPVAVDCRIEIPAGSALRFRTASAALRCSVGLSSFAGESASGDVELGPVAGEVTFTTASGDLSCGEVGGELSCKGASGDISVARVVGPVKVAVASGDLEIGDAATSVSAHSASGDVRLGQVHEGRVRVDTASGDITVGVAEGVGAYLDVTSAAGEMSCDLPFSEGSGAAEAAVQITCHSASGDIRIEPAAAR